MTLPVRFGGLGIPSPLVICDTEAAVSEQVTAPLVTLILEQQIRVRTAPENSEKP